MPYFAPIGQAVAEIWPLFNFSRWRPSAIFVLQKFKILNASKVRKANMHHHAKFRADRSKCCRGMTVCPCFKMVAVRHFAFLKVGNFNCWYGSENQCAPPAKFLADRSRRCQDMAVFDFPVGLLKVRKFNGPTLRMTNVRHRAKFHADRSSRCGDIGCFRFL